jgi:hypothetical protein
MLAPIICRMTSRSCRWGDSSFDPSGSASNALVAAGVVVVASAGNSGGQGKLSLGVFGTGSPADAESVISTASFDNSYFPVRWALRGTLILLLDGHSMAP